MAVSDTTIGPDLPAQLRRAVLEHIGSERRRHFAPLLHAGTPGGDQSIHALNAAEPGDHSLRTDIVAALRRRAARVAPAPLFWLTRPGALDVEDLDLTWLAAVRAAGAEAGLPLTFVVVTRRGWHDPATGEGRTWARLRQR